MIKRITIFSDKFKTGEIDRKTGKYIYDQMSATFDNPHMTEKEQERIKKALNNKIKEKHRKINEITDHIDQLERDMAYNFRQNEKAGCSQCSKQNRDIHIKIIELDRYRDYLKGNITEKQMKENIKESVESFMKNYGGGMVGHEFRKNLEKDAKNGY